MRKLKLSVLTCVFTGLILLNTWPVAAAQENGDGRSLEELDDWEPSIELGGAEDSLLSVGRLFDDIRIRSPLEDEFNGLYSRNRAEIHAIVDRNPALIWETVELVLDLLPSLRSADQNGGKLCVEKRLYARATDFFWKCNSLASPQLSADLMHAKTLIESRTTELNAHQLLVDLN